MNIKKYINFISWGILLIHLFFYCKKQPEIKEIHKNEFFIVLDTSGSMAFGPFTHVQNKFEEFLSLLKTNDTLYIITFDVEPRIIKKIENYDLTQKEEILKIVKDLKPTGQFTDFYYLLEFLKNLVGESPTYEEIQDAKNNTKTIIYKKQFVIVLTDGKDEPKQKRKRIHIKEYSDQNMLPIEDRYVYYINFSKEKSEYLEKNLEKLSPNVKTIQRTVQNGQLDSNIKENKENEKNVLTNQTEVKDPSGIEELKEDIKSKQNQNQLTFSKILSNIKNFFIDNAIYGILLLILVLLFFLFLYRRIKSGPMKGELTFYEVGMHPSMGKTLKLSRFERKKLTIGNDPDCLIRIKSLDFPRKIILLANDKKEGFFFKIPRKFLKEIQLLTESKSHIIQAGDKFKIKNYIFEYNYDNKYKKR